MAGYVELLAGTPREIEEAREKGRQNGFQNRQRRVTESVPAAPGAVVVEQPTAVVAQEPDAPAAVEEQAPPPVAAPVQPRRKVPPAVAQAAPAGAEDDELGATEVEPAGVEGNGNGHLVEK